MRQFAWRWLAVSVFIVSSTLNYLDRQLLVFLAPLIIRDLRIDQTRFGLLISAFSIAYAASSLVTGWFLDKAGINKAISLAIAWWSIAPLYWIDTRAYGTGRLPRCARHWRIGRRPGGWQIERHLPQAGRTRSRRSGESNRAQLRRDHRAFVDRRSDRLRLAPALRCHRLMGFLWIPLWLGVSRLIPARYADQELAPTRGIREFALLGDRSLILLVVVNVLWMGSYSLWSNWTTLYLVHVHNLTLQQTASYVWIPPLISNFGGFFGGWLSLRWIRHGRDAVAARRRAIWFSAVGFLVTLLLPLLRMPLGRRRLFLLASSSHFQAASTFTRCPSISSDLPDPDSPLRP